MIWLDPTNILVTNLKSLTRNLSSAFFDRPKAIKLVFAKFGTRLLETNHRFTEVTLIVRFSINVNESLALAVIAISSANRIAWLIFSYKPRGRSLT